MFTQKFKQFKPEPATFLAQTPKPPPLQADRAVLEPFVAGRPLGKGLAALFGLQRHARHCRGHVGRFSGELFVRLWNSAGLSSYALEPSGAGGGFVAFRLHVRTLTFPGSIAKGLFLKAAANFTCQLLMSTCQEVVSPANFSCQLFESYCTCQLLMPTFRELLHLPPSHANILKVISPANFSCQLHLSTSPASFSRVMSSMALVR